jgi:hypothetical protein
MKPNLFTCLLLVVSLTIKAQITDTYIGKSLSLQANKTYLSFDKPYYTAGETMYFKAFLNDATSHAPDSVTTVLYVDFIEIETERVIVQQKIKVTNGHASGSFNTEGVKGGLFIHAYTRWMGNLAADYHFNKNIQVFEAIDPAALVRPPRENDTRVIVPARKLDVPEVNNEAIKKGQVVISPTGQVLVKPEKGIKKVKSLQFFPESGNLLVGFPNRLAFKATDDEGKGIAVKGLIKNEKGDSITAFADSFLGMGRFNLIAKKGENYTAYIKNQYGSTTSFPLPNSQTNNAAIGIDRANDTGTIRITLLMAYDTAAMPNAFFLIAHQRGKVCFSQNIYVNNKQIARVVKMMIPPAAFPEEGIATITLFDNKGKPLAERLVFIKNDKRQLNIQLTSNKQVFKKREQVTVSIETKTRDGQPVAADLSFVVTNNEKITSPQYSEDLRAYMLLRSDLRGHIEQPAYYFEDTTAKSRLALDNLLMTQGWRRFNWQSQTDTALFNHEQGLTVQMVMRNGKKTINNTPLALILAQEGKSSQSILGQTDKQGRMRADNLDFIDSARLIVKLSNSLRYYTVEEKQPRTPPSVSEPKIYLAEQPTGNLNTYLESSQIVLLSEKLRVEKEIALQEFEIRGKKQISTKDTRLSNQTADHIYIISEDGGGPVINYLRTKFVNVYKSYTGVISLQHGRASDFMYLDYALVIDGVTQIDGYMLPTMTMDDIERIDITEAGNGGYATSAQTNGVVHILTKGGDINYWKTHKNDAPMLFLMGYSQQKQFYTPEYDVKKPEYADPDHRTTLYWSPTVHTDATGKATVSFYTTDDAQTARILVEGIDGTGKVGVVKGQVKVN